MSAGGANIFLHGATGRMGRAIIEVAKDPQQPRLAGVLELRSGHIGESWSGYLVYDRIPDGGANGSVVVDFSRPEALSPLIDAVSSRGVSLVCGTTGLGATERGLLEKRSEVAPVFYDENMSYGISVLKYMLRDAAPRLGGWDAEIVEYHHSGKHDYPSGTALALARILAAEDGIAVGRSPERSDVHIHSVRAGDIPGEHQVIFASTGEVLTFAHRALSRAVFATGALRAARYIASKDKGMYNMEDLIRDEKR